jgi:hypothetical protein
MTTQVGANLMYEDTKKQFITSIQRELNANGLIGKIRKRKTSHGYNIFVDVIALAGDTTSFGATVILRDTFKDVVLTSGSAQFATYRILQIPVMGHVVKKVMSIIDNKQKPTDAPVAVANKAPIIYDRHYGDVVHFHTPFKGSGVVCGCSTTSMAVLGRGWIVMILDGNKDDLVYPFTHCVVFDGHII